MGLKVFDFVRFVPVPQYWPMTSGEPATKASSQRPTKASSQGQQKRLHKGSKSVSTMAVEASVQRLRRLMCGGAVPRRNVPSLRSGYAARTASGLKGVARTRGLALIVWSMRTARQSHAAHRRGGAAIQVRLSLSLTANRRRAFCRVGLRSRRGRATPHIVAAEPQYKSVSRIPYCQPPPSVL